jgi:hypothetical protein
VFYGARFLLAKGNKGLIILTRAFYFSLLWLLRLFFLRWSFPLDCLGVWLGGLRWLGKSFRSEHDYP